MICASGIKLSHFDSKRIIFSIPTSLITPPKKYSRCSSSPVALLSQFRTKDRGPPGLMKLSPNGKLAILQRHINSVDIILLDRNDGTCAVEFNLPTKSKDMILSVDWITNNQVLFVTKQSLELFSVNEEKKSAKLLRTLNVSACWSLFYVCVDINTPVTENLLEKDVTVASIYGEICVMVLRYSVDGSSAADLVIYELTSDVHCVAKMKYSLTLGCSGGFGIHVIDNLVIVHHQVTAKSMIFDVAFSPNRPTHSPLITTSISEYTTCVGASIKICRLSDPIAGMMYQLALCCDRAPEEIADKCTLIEFLVHRSNTKSLVLSTLLESLKSRVLRLRQVRKLFDLIVEKFALSSAAVMSHSESTKAQLIAVDVEHLRIEQADMQSSIFIPFMAKYIRFPQKPMCPVSNIRFTWKQLSNWPETLLESTVKSKLKE
ncbi:Mic1 domain-containing protein [Trichostrongylus colubriformis]|uniref:Mic1 domain-containing protein n=1 Tax=Trichostrongylus colubriformis TaxID=6319 RepID=A0AAN8IF31_TRICO